MVEDKHQKLARIPAVLLQEAVEVGPSDCCSLAHPAIPCLRGQVHRRPDWWQTAVNDSPCSLWWHYFSPGRFPGCQWYKWTWAGLQAGDTSCHSGFRRLSSPSRPRRSQWEPIRCLSATLDQLCRQPRNQSVKHWDVASSSWRLTDWTHITKQILNCSCEQFQEDPSLPKVAYQIPCP